MASLFTICGASASSFVILVSSFLLFPRAAHSAPDPDFSPDQREVWTPTDQLKQILAKYPNAVVLTREQYENLIREAGIDRKAAPQAPRRAALTSAKYQAHVAGKVVQVTGTFTVNVLSDEWAQLPLNFKGVALGAVTVDGEAALPGGSGALPPHGKSKRGANAGGAPIEPGSLFLRGKGERAAVVEFSIPIATRTGVSSFEIQLPQAAASVFVLELPPDQRVESAQSVAVKMTPETTTVTAALSPANPTLNLKWRGTGGGSQALAAQVTALGTYTIDAANVRSEYELDIQTPLGNLAGAYSIALPANAKVLQVTGDEIANWEITDGKLRVAFKAGERASTKLRLAMESPSLAEAPAARLTLPVPRFDGVSRMQGTFSIVGDDGVIVKEIATDASAEAARPAAAPAAHWIASYRFNAPPNSLDVAVEKVRPRFSADLDTRVEFKLEAIFIERTLTLHTEKGEIFDVVLTLPAGEELLSVRDARGSEPDWQIQDRKLGLRWTSDDAGGAGRQFKIRTRAEPANWSQIGGEGLPFTLGDMKIEGAERVTGYIALKADDAFRLEAEPSETLERRDGRTTPVQGDYAWFRGADFTLRVKVAKRPAEVIAALTGYALPLEGVLDLHAQINYTFLHSGTRSVRIRVPKEIAANFHFDGPQIAERNLVDDVWTIVFQKELTGDYAMKITGQVAVEKTGSVSKPGDGADAGSEKESRFEIAIPVITPLDVVRTSGVWAVEANTETEITFAAKGMNELDSLLAPRLADYQPRHRVIGVFTWLGPDYSLALSGVRHAAASILTSVVDRLDLDTVVSSSGTERNQATFQLRTAGAQSMDVQLPENSRLLSLSVNGEAIKPVGDRSDQVRIELPGTSNSDEALEVSILYETPKSPWHGSGGYSVRAPKLARTIPILRSQWRLFLPDGFEYTGIDSNFSVPALDAERPLAAGILDGAISVGRFAIRETRRLKENALPPPNLAPQYAVPNLNSQWNSQPGIVTGFQTPRNELNLISTAGLATGNSVDLNGVTIREPNSPQFNSVGVTATSGTTVTAGGNIVTFAGIANGSGALSRSATTTISGVINGSGGVDMTGGGNFTLSGANTYTGGTVISGGTLGLGVGSVNAGAATLEMQPTGGEPNPATLEMARRGDYEKQGSDAIENGDKAMRDRYYEKAFSQYKFACDIIQYAPASHHIYDRALPSLCNAGCKLAEQRITEGRYADAEDVLKIVTGERYDPKCKRAIVLLAHLQQPDYYNKTVGPQFRAKVEQVKQYFIEAQGFYDSGRFDLAMKRCDQILAIDKYNIAARKMEEKIDRAKSGYGVVAYSETRAPAVAYGETRAKAMANLDLQWSKPVRRSEMKSSGDVAPEDSALANRTERIGDKLKRIIIPKLVFREATLREAIDFLKKKSVDLDVDSPVGDKGVNIVLKLDSGNEPPPAAPATNPEDARITVSLTNIPLIEALRYVTSLAALKFKVEPYAVFIMPASVNTDVLITKEWKVRPDLIPNPGAPDAAKNWLISNGVQFNGPGASAVYLPVPTG